MKLRALLCVTAVALSGCATLMKHDKNQGTAEANWERHRAAVEQIAHFSLHARVSSGGLFGVKGDLNWRQNDDGSFEVRVSGPFGVGAVSIQGTEDHVEVRTRSGVYPTPDPERWIKDKMGWTLPLLGLRHWVLGLPWSHSEAHLELDIDGQAVELEQDGWRVEYAEYQQVGQRMLPRLFTLKNKDLKIKVLVDRWEDVA